MGGARLSDEQKKELLAKMRKPILKGKVTPYIALGYIGKDGVRDGKYDELAKKKKHRYRPRPSLMILDISGCHKAPSAVTNYLNKGYEIIDYYIPDRPEDPSKEDEYIRMRAHLAHIKTISNAKVNASKVSQLERELEKAQEELAKAKKGKKNES